MNGFRFLQSWITYGIKNIKKKKTKNDRDTQCLVCWNISGFERLFNHWMVFKVVVVRVLFRTIQRFIFLELLILFLFYFNTPNFPKIQSSKNLSNIPSSKKSCQLQPRPFYDRQATFFQNTRNEKFGILVVHVMKICNEIVTDYTPLISSSLYLCYRSSSCKWTITDTTTCSPRS